MAIKVRINLIFQCVMVFFTRVTAFLFHESGCRLWVLNLNPLKCEHLCISYKHFPPTYNYTIRGQRIPLKPVIRYLGILINSYLKWGDHCKHLSAKATRSLNYLQHTLFSCPMYIKEVAYKSLIRPVLEYVSPVWCLHTSKDISPLESVQQHAAC